MARTAQKRFGPKGPPAIPPGLNPLDGPCRIEVGAAYLGLSVPSTRRLANAGKIQWVDLGVNAAILWGPSLTAFAENRVVAGKRLAPVQPEPGRRGRGRPRKTTMEASGDEGPAS